MCGITGFIDFSRQLSRDELEPTVARMTETLVHRGPDDGGVWVDREVGIALGHRRLSIIDLSPQGHQPMLSQSGRYVIVFNGEIYNFQEIRRELDVDGKTSLAWRGHADTEVMLAAFERWGIEESLKRFVGMFAFALWDRHERQLLLVRDRLGEKPLYYGTCGKTFFFASELKALLQFPAFRPEINRNAVALYMRHSCIPAPYSIYNGVHKLLPGTMLTIAADAQGWSGVPSFTPKPYWQARSVAQNGVAEPFNGNDAEATEHLDRLLRVAVQGQMVADVPLGAFLSGGVDSSTIAALMQAQSSRPVRTFTIDYGEKQFSEAAHAKAVARHIGTDHTELSVTPVQALGVVTKMATIYDEPFADASQVPTFLLAQLTRKHVTVSLSGDGGDELFAGYNRHFRGRELWRLLKRWPVSIRRGIAFFLTSASPQSWDQIFGCLSWALPSNYRERVPGERLHKLAGILAAKSADALYYGLVSHWGDPLSVVQNASEPLTVVTDMSHWPNLDDFAQMMMYLDLVSYLPDDILVKVDRAGMGASLETRMPFLDHNVVEFAWKVPLSMKIRKGQGKWLLRQVLYRYVPPGLIERPKMGFGMPLSVWLRGPLKDWAESLLDEKRLREEGYFNPGPIRKKWQEHLSQRCNWQYQLWDVLMFQEWLAEQKNVVRRTP